MAALRDIACRLGGRSAVLALGLLALAVPAASAATATVSSGALTYTAATGETNQLTITRSGGTFTLSDSGALITAGAGCASGGARIVTCTAASLSVDTGDRDDVITVGAGAPATLNGGSGNDQLLDPSGGAANTFIGGTGTDRVSYAGRAAAITADIDGVADDGAPGELDNVR
ncbi:MAG: hypothetical protein QOE08_49, partial [Thermoleophilaceae bacterium]|nr:hypothetical protein [Thermoleophilaceae bacterium]